MQIYANNKYLLASSVRYSSGKLVNASKQTILVLLNKRCGPSSAHRHYRPDRGGAVAPGGCGDCHHRRPAAFGVMFVLGQTEAAGMQACLWASSLLVLLSWISSLRLSAMRHQLIKASKRPVAGEL